MWSAGPGARTVTTPVEMERFESISSMEDVAAPASFSSVEDVAAPAPDATERPAAAAMDAAMRDALLLRKFAKLHRFASVVAGRLPVRQAAKNKVKHIFSR